MIEARDDLWNVPAQIVVITTNGVVKANGKCVMGRGCAQQARDRFPGLDLQLGAYLTKYGNRPFYLGIWDGIPIASMPTKHEWHQKADLTLIVDSARKLVLMADKFNWQSIVMPRPGCGNGGLDWECPHQHTDDVCLSVKAHIEGILDDRFVVVTHA